MIEAPPAAGDSAKVPAPPTTLPWAPGTPRPLSDEDLKKWEARLARGEARCKLFHPQMERGLKRYAQALIEKQPEDINALLDFRHVEGKKSDLFFDTPDVTLVAIDPADESIPFPILLPLRQKFLNHDIGPEGANAKRAMHKTLLDTLAASGWMITVVGYEAVKLPVPPDPLTGMPSMDANGQPVTEVTIWSRRFIEAISSKKTVIPDDFTDSSNFDAAPWLAYKGVMPILQARRAKWKIPQGFTGTAQKDDHVYKHGEVTGDPNESMLEYTIIWLKASLYDEAVFNPELYRCLVLVKGLEEPAWYVDSPFQSLTPTGQLTDDSMRGNPIHIGTLRDLTDSAHVPSDLVVGEQLSLEENKFRTDLILNRRQRRTRLLVAEGLGQPTIDKLAQNTGPVTVPDAYIDAGGAQRAVAVVNTGTEPRDNYTAQEIIERDYDEALGRGANQRGQTAKRKTTATEARIVQGNSSARAQTEKGRGREYFVALLRKYDAVVQRTVTREELLKVLGAQGAQLYEQWKMLPGRYGYDILPDSGQYVDAHEYTAHVLDTYNLLRKDERVNTDDLLEMVARALNRNPAKFIAPPPQPKSEAPSMSINFKGEDAAVPPMWNLLMDFCASAGLKVSPQTLQAFQAQSVLTKLMGAVQPGEPKPDNAHGGSADRTEPVNKHQSDVTGGVQGVGAGLLQ